MLITSSWKFFNLNRFFHNASWYLGSSFAYMSTQSSITRMSSPNSQRNMVGSPHRLINCCHINIACGLFNLIALRTSLALWVLPKYGSVPSCLLRCNVSIVRLQFSSLKRLRTSDIYTLNGSSTIRFRKALLLGALYDCLSAA